jgi:triacylglycerol lipase
MWIQKMDHFLKDFGRGDHGSKSYQKFFFSVCALLAYKDLNTVDEYFRKVGFGSVNLIGEDGVQCYIVYNDKAILIIFCSLKGTKSNIIDPLIKGNSPLIGAKKLDKIWISVRTCIDSNSDKDIYIAGHGLGGAMATIAASRIQKHANFKQVFTYGSPRVGDRKFVDSCDFRHIRVQNNNDAVSKIPSALLGYKHMCEPTYMNYYGNIRKLTCWQTTKDRWRSLKIIQMVDDTSDHDMDKYCTKLHKLWQKENRKTSKWHMNLQS